VVAYVLADKIQSAHAYSPEEGRRDARYQKKPLGKDSFDDAIERDGKSSKVRFTSRRRQRINERDASSGGRVNRNHEHRIKKANAGEGPLGKRKQVEPRNRKGEEGPSALSTLKVNLPRLTYERSGEKRKTRGEGRGFQLFWKGLSKSSKGSAKKKGRIHV